MSRPNENLEAYRGAVERRTNPRRQAARALRKAAGSARQVRRLRRAHRELQP